QGAFSFSRIELDSVSAAGTPLPFDVEGFTVGADDVDLFMGYASESFDPARPFSEQADALYGFGAEDVRVGFLSARNLLGGKHTAVSASSGAVRLYGIDPADFQVSASGVNFALNTSSGLARPIDFKRSFPVDAGQGRTQAGYSIATGGAPVLIDFAGDTRTIGMRGATLGIAGFAHLSGSFGVDFGGRRTLPARSPLGNPLSVKADSFTIGATGVSAFVGVGGPYRTDTNGDGAVTASDAIANPDAMGLLIDDLSFALGLFRDSANRDRFVALTASAGQAGFIGFGEQLDLSVSDLDVAINYSSNPARTADFSALEGGGLRINNGQNDVLIDFDSALTRVSAGHVTADLMGLFHFEGGLSFERKIIDAVSLRGLGMAVDLPAEALIVAGRDLQAFTGINGPYLTDSNRNGSFDDEVPSADAIGFALNDVDLAFAMLQPALGGGQVLPISFYGIKASAASGGIVGTDPYLTLQADDLVFELNGAMSRGKPLPTVYADFSSIDAGGLEIPFGLDGPALNIDFDNNLIGVGISGTLGVFDLFTISPPRLDFRLELPDFDLGIDLDLSGVGLPGFQMPQLPDIDPAMLLPSMRLGDLGAIVPEISASAPDWLLSGIELLRDIDIRIGLTGVTGSIELPDLSLSVSEFVHLNGDFKINLGQSFTADMATGLDPMLAASADAVIREIESQLLPPNLPASDILRSVFDLSDDYSIAHDIDFKGISLGGNDIDLFIGQGTPNFDRSLSEQSGLLGFGLQGLSIGIGSFKADLPKWLKAGSVFSFSASADEMGAYGFGDALKILGEAITLEVNTGGKALGGFMRAMPAYSSVQSRDRQGNPVAGVAIDTGGEPVILDFAGHEIIGLDIGRADIAVADFLHLSGALAFRKGEVYDVAVNPGGIAPVASRLGIDLDLGADPIPLRVSAVTLGGAALSGFAGVGGPYRYGPDNDGDGLRDQINGGAVGLAVDNVDFGIALLKPVAFDLIPSLKQYLPQFVSAKATIGEAALVGIDESILSAKAEDVEVNINTFYWSLPDPATSKAVNAGLQLFGPPSINFPASKSFQEEDQDQDGAIDPGEDRNRNGTLDPAGFAVPAGGGRSVLIDHDEEIIQAKVGYAELNLAGFLQVSASMALTKRGAETVTLSNGDQASVSTIALGISNANGFVGIPSFENGVPRGYFVDADGDGRIEGRSVYEGGVLVRGEEDPSGGTRVVGTNDSAFGIAIEQLDLGVVLAREMVIGPSSLDFGVYLAAYADVREIAVVGLPDGITVKARDLRLELNTGARATLPGDFNLDPLSGIVSVDLANIDLALASIDFSRSNWLNPTLEANRNASDADDQFSPGYAIETGDPARPIVLNYERQWLRIAGQAELNLYDLVRLTGVVDFRLDEEEGLTVFADVTASIGPGDLKISRRATGLLVLNDGGVALLMDVEALKLDLGEFVQLDAELVLTLNSFGEEIVYEVPEAFRSTVGLDEVVVPAYPPGKDPSWAGPYAALAGKGKLNLFDGSLEMVGDFAAIVAEVDGAITFEIGANAILDLPVIEPLGVVGTLGFVIDGADTGLYGSLEIGGAGRQSLLIDAGAFSVAGQFLLQVNTTGRPREVRGRDPESGEFLDPEGKPFQVMVPERSLRISGKASIAVGPIELRGSVDLLIDKQGIQAAMDVVLDLGLFGEVGFKGAAAIINTGSEVQFALRVETNLSFGIAAVNISAKAILEINTGSDDYIPIGSDTRPIEGGTLFRLELDGALKILALEAEFNGVVSIVDEVLELRINKATFDFFGFIAVDVSGYVRSDGNFLIQGKVDIEVDMVVLSLKAGMSVTFSNRQFALSVYGSLDIDIDLGFFSIKRTLAGFSGEIELTAASASLAARVTVAGFSISGSYSWSWGAPPVITHQIDDVLYLNAGDVVDRYGDSDGELYGDVIHETYRIEAKLDDEGEPIPGVVMINALGESKKHEGVSKVVFNGGRGNDTVMVYPGVDAVLEINGGPGVDTLMIMGGGPGSVVRGGPGNDRILGGLVPGLKVYGDEGNDIFSGGEAGAIIDLGPGRNVIQSGTGDDEITIRGSELTTLSDAGGNNRIRVESTQEARLTFSRGRNEISADWVGLLHVEGGVGEEVVIFDDLTSTQALELQASGLLYDDRTLTFNAELDRVEINDLSTAGTVLKSTEDANWGSTDLVLNAAGLLNLEEAVLTAPNGHFDLQARGIVGEVRTELGALTLVNLGQTDNIAVTVREVDDLILKAGTRGTAGGLITDGPILIESLAAEGLLTLESGALRSATGGITLIADDLDFASGDDRVSAPGELIITTKTPTQGYRIGSAGQSVYANDRSINGATGFLELGMRDVSALRDGFSAVRIGHA
ncbi:MAG: hypothetical protein RL322_1796, partial [Pseudomonadota bacterium]